jgi:heme a synthase
MSTYDEKIYKLFYNWLAISFILIFSMIIIGGLTRLTDSGLSITEWELFKGILPPLNTDKWNEYFYLYKKIPQYKLLYENMTLSDFKIIYYWEYFHRLLGRLIGIFFLLPLIYFYYSGVIKKKYLSICFVIFLLILFQGFVGWYMVKSGLVNNITVSHYRLSLHLGVAFIIISIIFWNLLNIKNKNSKNFFLNNVNNYYFYALILLIFIQIVVGAFVSGLDAGKIYQTWPLMNYTYFPNDVSIDKVNDLLKFDNHSLIQFYHRNIAYLIMIYILIMGYYIFKKNIYKIKIPFYYVMSFTILQVLLGILTLTSGLNIYLASAHQICGLLLILSVVNLYYNYIK